MGLDVVRVSWPPVVSTETPHALGFSGVTFVDLADDGVSARLGHHNSVVIKHCKVIGVNRE